MTCTPKYIGKFVNVYLTDRAYGGPEEGGWWYDYGEAYSSEQFIGDEIFAAKILAVAREWCEEENRHRRSDTNSVLSQGCYVARIECHPAQDYPAEKPHYE